MVIQQKQQRVRVNEQIRVPEVRLIGPDGEQIGIMPIREALSKAGEAHLDLEASRLAMVSLKDLAGLDDLELFPPDLE